MKPEEMTTDFLDAALEYAESGYRVFPCKPSGKEPLTKHGFKNATDDEGCIRAWWARHPKANIGVRGGDGLILVDCDKKHDGPERWECFIQAKGGSLDTTCVRTGGGGFHYWYAVDEELYVETSQGLVIDGERQAGIDIRGTNGYCIAPPSTHVSGGSYAFVRDLDHLRAAPPWLVQLVLN